MLAFNTSGEGDEGLNEIIFPAETGIKHRGPMYMVGTRGTNPSVMP